MFFAKIPRHIRQNAITEGDLECILTRNCEGTEQLRFILYMVYIVICKICLQGEAPSNQYHGIIIEKQCQARKTECK